LGILGRKIFWFSEVANPTISTNTDEENLIVTVPLEKADQPLVARGVEAIDESEIAERFGECGGREVVESSIHLNVREVDCGDGIKSFGLSNCQRK
jgi:hypothetical protein